MTVQAFGELWPPFSGVRRIAVLRGGGLGDLLLAMPAVESLAAAYPKAEITLLGSALHAELLHGRPSPFYSIEILPQGFGMGPGVADPLETSQFLHRMQARRFDLAIQLHGGGRHSNPFLLNIGATHTVGRATEDAVPLERTLPYLHYQHDLIKALEVVALAGVVPTQLEPQLRLTADEVELRAHNRATKNAPKILLHPGATDLRRRWPSESFAGLAVQLVLEDGAQVVIIGDQNEMSLAEQVLARTENAPAGRVSSIAGQTSLAELIKILLQASVLVANDSGLRHLAGALGIPTVGIYWCGNLINAGPLSRTQDRVQISWTTHCPVCACDAVTISPNSARCEHDVSFVTEIAVADVLEDVHALLSDKR